MDNEPNTFLRYLALRTEDGEFEQLVDELTDLLYTGFEAGGAAGNLPQVGELVRTDEAAYAIKIFLPNPIEEYLVIPDKETLRHSIEQILDAHI